MGSMTKAEWDALTPAAQDAKKKAVANMKDMFDKKWDEKDKSDMMLKKKMGGMSGAMTKDQ